MQEVDAFAKEARLPILLGGLPAKLQDRKELAARGVRIALQGHHPFMAALSALRATMQALRDGAPLPDTLPKADLDRLSGEALWQARSDDFLDRKGD